MMSVHRNDDGLTIFLNDGTFIRLTPEETETLEYNVRTTEYQPPAPLRPHELAEIFGGDRESKKDLKETLDTLKREINEELEALMEEENNYRATLTKLKDRDTLELHEWGIEQRRKKLLERKDHIERVLSFMGAKGKKKAMDFQLELQKAKSYPIEQLLNFSRGVKTQCIWHEDRNPSLHLYRKNNTVWCFACNKGGDAIDVVMQMRDCSMHEAIAFINNH